MIKTICYISNKNEDLSNDELDDLLKYLVKKNDEIHISGILMLKNNHFFQIMEGEADTVNNLYDVIKKDLRPRTNCGWPQFSLRPVPS